MSDIDGIYDCVSKTPLGEQKSVLTIKTDGNTFTGSNNGAQGDMPIEGEVDGNVLTWQMKITQPFAMTLNASVAIEDGKLDGGVKAGAFGTSPITGTKRA